MKIPQIIAALSYACLVSSLRTIADFDFGWRWRRGVGNVTCPADAFPYNYTGLRCLGLSGSHTSITEAECASACCDSFSCDIWQFCPDCGGCWIGIVTNCTRDRGWVSYARNVTNSTYPPEVQPTFDDSAWTVLDLPHDSIITEDYVNDSALSGQAFLPKVVSWYRKHFSLPAEWLGSYVELYVEGAFASTQWYINGQLVRSHSSGYTSFTVRLDNTTALAYGGAANVLAAYVDPTTYTGWWYEGGGIYRHISIMSTDFLHIEADSVFAPANLAGPFIPNGDGTPAAGLTVATASLVPRATVVNNRAEQTVANVTWYLYASNGTLVSTSTNSTPTLSSANSSFVLSGPPLVVTSGQAWSVPRPYLYTLVTTVQAAGSDTVVDSVNTSVGLREVQFTSDEGMFLNEQHVKARGFCNHNSFTGVGVAVPDRLNLLRMQAMRGVGGNSWRMSHNPPSPRLLDLADRLGVTVLDENRVFADTQQALQDMSDLVSRDRNHPSVVYWSFCNEAGCGSGGTEPALDFKVVADSVDGSRAVTANMNGAFGGNMSDILDLQGFSHSNSNVLFGFHEQHPQKPIVSSECCSCETQRGEDEDMPRNESVAFWNNENQGCVANQTQESNGPAWNVGSYVWTLFDYYGEPYRWPHISSSYGSFDLSGFPKAAVWWYRSWWFGNISNVDAGRPPVPNTAFFIHIVESWQAPVLHTNRTIHVYSNAPMVSLALNGAPVGGPPQPMVTYGQASFSVPFAIGNLTAIAWDKEAANVLATHSTFSWGPAAAIALTLDAPSLTTGTGLALFLDGEDVAAVRATIIDINGNHVRDSSANVSFSVVSGPGVVWATGNGDPANQEPNDAPSRLAYHGLVRGIIRVTAVATFSDEHAGLLKLLNPDAGVGSRSARIMQFGAAPMDPIVIQASSPGLPPVTLSIPTSVDPADSVLAVAAVSVGLAYIGD